MVAASVVLLAGLFLFNPNPNFEDSKTTELKSLFKVGAANVGGKEYQSAPGSPYIGSQFFVSWVFNQ